MKMAGEYFYNVIVTIAASRISQPESESSNSELGDDVAPQVSRPGRNYLRRGGN